MPRNQHAGTRTKKCSRLHSKRLPFHQTRLLRKHELTTLQERRLKLCLGFFYKVVEGLLPAITPCDFIIPQKPGQRIHSTRHKSTYLLQNPVENYTWNNDRCCCVPESHTDQYCHSFFPKTIVEWNHLDNTIVHQKSVDSFKSALAKARSQQCRQTAHPYRRTYASKWMYLSRSRSRTAFKFLLTNHC